MKLIAPNGKPSNLNAEQYKLVRTPAFKKWFGDWENDPENASKVVDENGEPLVCFHGSEQGGFSVFDEKRVGDNTKNADIGFYFSNTFQNARSYSDTTAKNIISTTPSKTNYTVFLKLITPKIIFWGKNNVKVSWNKTVDGFNGLNEFVRSAYKEGFDGAIAKNIDDTGKNDCFYDCGSIVFVAFKSNQIKLADGSNTTFDNNNDDIRYEKGGLLGNFNYSIGGL